MRSLKDLAYFMFFLLALFAAIFGARYIFSFLDRTNHSSLDDLVVELRSENLLLRSEIEKLLHDNVILRDFDNIITPVYSRYPFNGYNLITVGTGNKDGIKESMSVFTAEDVLIGSVRRVKNYQSEIMTIFDNNWSSNVFIGDNLINAVLEGGREPKLGLIPDDADINPGDIIYSASSDYPTNSVIGEVGEVFYEVGDIWKTAEIDFPYDISNLRSLKIYLNFP